MLLFPLEHTCFIAFLYFRKVGNFDLQALKGHFWSWRAVIVIMAYFSWMAFLDENNLMVQYKRHRKLKELEKNKDYYSAEIKRVSHELYELSNNPETLEKFAREHYWMKRPDEDVFVLVAQEK